MPSILDAPLYPFDQPAARELHMALCELYPSSNAAKFAAAKVGIQEWELDTNQPAYLVWKEILEEAAKRRATRALVQIVAAEKPTSPRQVFFQALLANLATPPLNLDTTKFNKTPEALLYHDDLTLPVSDVPALIAALEKLRAIAPAVCKFEVTCPGLKGNGTGFRIADDLLLTNWHVLYMEGNAPAQILATFGYEGTSAGTTVECDPASVRAHQGDDWGVVKMKQPPPAGTPIVALAGAAEPVKGAGAFVIQHPGGDRKRVAYARNHISYFDGEVVHYMSDTQTGSSGSPVFDGEGRLIALHRAGGEPQEVAGQTPIRLNEGVRIPRVRKGLTQAGINL